MQTRGELLNILIARSWEDPTFKDKLIADPKGTVEGLTGERLPVDFQVNVIQETPKHVTVVIPRNPEDPLTEEELEQVVGGIKIGPEEQMRYINNIFRRF